MRESTYNINLLGGFTPEEARRLLNYVLVEFLVNSEDAPTKKQDIALLFDCLDEALSPME